MTAPVPDATGSATPSTTSKLAAPLHPLAGIALAMLAAAITYAAIVIVHPIFVVGKEFDVPSIGMPTELFLRNRQEQDKVESKHAMIYCGGLGLLIAVALAAGEAAKRRFWLAPLLAAPLGAVGGAIGGYLGSLVQVYVRTNIGQAELTHTIGTQLALALPLGLGIGLGVGLATRSFAGTLKSALAGLAGGGLAAALYPILVSTLLPAASTETLLPDETASRVLWFAVYAVLLGAIIPVASRTKKTPS